MYIISSTEYLNNQALSLVLLEDVPNARALVHQVPQTAPGRYELSLAAPTTPTFASIHHGKQVLDRISLPGRYPAEFEAIGNDTEAMHKLAESTGGAVINPTDNRPIDFNFPRKQLSLSTWLAVAASLCIALAWASAAAMMRSFSEAASAGMLSSNNFSSASAAVSLVLYSPSWSAAAWRSLAASSGALGI